MSKHDVAKLACRIIAVWVLVQLALDIFVNMSIVAGVALADAMPMAPRMMMSFLSLAVVAVRLAVGVLLWLKADALATRMTADIGDGAPPAEARFTEQQVLRIALPLIGFLILPTGLSRFAEFISVLVATSSSELESSRWSIAPLVSTVLILALSAWLILGARGIANLIVHLRTSGRSKD